MNGKSQPQCFARDDEDVLTEALTRAAQSFAMLVNEARLPAERSRDIADLLRFAGRLEEIARAVRDHVASLDISPAKQDPPEDDNDPESHPFIQP